MTDPREIEQLVEAVRGALLNLPNATADEAAVWNQKPLLDLDRLATIAKTAARERDEALHAEDVAERYREAAEERVRELEAHVGVVPSFERGVRARYLSDT